jgi:cardiolipin synthase C
VTAVRTPIPTRNAIRRAAVSVAWSLVGGLGACAQLPTLPDLADDLAVPQELVGALDQQIAALEARHPDQSAFRLVVDGPEAFITRVQSARRATRSLDVQTYIWHADLTGKFLAQTLIEAADRGVRVRVLLDDMDARAKNAGFAALAAHPGIEVRLFNPFASRRGPLRLLGEGLRRFSRINHRMHNKSWIADNRVALVGGRNLGDEYFGASDAVNFVDLDFAMIGPVVRDVSASFDEYWNSPLAYPLEILDAASVNAAALERLRVLLAAHAREAQSSRYAAALRSDDAMARLVAGDWPMEWTTTYEFVSDDPLKSTMESKDADRTRVGTTLAPLIQHARTRLTVISPYFVPGKATTAKLVDAVRAGKEVRVLTNSLAANDVAAVHGGYSTYRKPLLEGGVRLWELKPLGGRETNKSMFGSSGASLHTKALSVDSEILFVGSYNLDPRSTWLNCEQGVVVENATLARQLEGIFRTETAGNRAWHVTLDGRDLRWSDDQERFDSEPYATWTQRFQAWMARVLHLEAQL